MVTMQDTALHEDPQAALFHEESTELIKALVGVQLEMPPIPKNKEMQAKGGRRYRYADLADVLAVVRPVLAKHGIALLQPLVMGVDGMFLSTRLIHVSGQGMECQYPINKAADPHQFGAALTYARRYSITSLLGVAADDDDDAASVAHPDAGAARQHPVDANEPAVDEFTSEALQSLLGAIAIGASTEEIKAMSVNLTEPERAIAIAAWRRRTSPERAAAKRAEIRKGLKQSA